MVEEERGLAKDGLCAARFALKLMIEERLIGIVEPPLSQPTPAAPEEDAVVSDEAWRPLNFCRDVQHVEVTLLSQAPARASGVSRSFAQFPKAPSMSVRTMLGMVKGLNVAVLRKSQFEGGH